MRSVDEAFAHHYPAEAAEQHCLAPATALHNDHWNRLVVHGDSIAAGLTAPVDGYMNRSFADRFDNALAATRPDYASINPATPHLRVHEIRYQQLSTALGFRPEIAVVTVGADHTLSCTFSPKRLQRDLDRLLRPLAESSALVVTVGMFDQARAGIVQADRAAILAPRFDQFDAITAQLTHSLGGVHIDSYRHPLAATPAIFTSDGYHANARGHAIAFGAMVGQLASQPLSLDRPTARPGEPEIGEHHHAPWGRRRP